MSDFHPREPAKAAEPLTRAHIEEAAEAIKLLLAGVAAGLPARKPEDGLSEWAHAETVKKGLSRAGEQSAYWLGQAAEELEGCG